MPEECMNIYKAARRAAGFTQERAAELLGISVRSLADYETGQRIPNNHVVGRMSTVYSNIPLGVQHVLGTDTIIAQVVPQLEKRSLMEMALRIYNRLNRFSKDGGVDRLLSIAEDGRIDQTERPEFDSILADLQEIVQSGLELAVYCNDGKEGDT